MRTSAEGKTEKPGLPGFEIQEALVGLALDKTDASIIKYLSFFSEHVPLQSVTFLHVISSPKQAWPFSAVFPEKEVELSPEKEAEVAQAMKAETKKLPPHLAGEKLKYVIKDGSVLDEFVSLSAEKNAGLIIVGKRPGHRSGVLAKNLIRQARTNLLMVPEQSHGHLRTIVVPIDFSDNSIRALKAALAIKYAAGKGAKVIALNIYQRPDLLSYKVDMTPEQFERNIRENHEKGFEKFISEQLPGFEKEIHPLLVESGLPDIANQILEQSLEAKADLIIVGSRGHSQLERLLLGSTTETLLNINEQAPLMVVK